MFLNLFDIIIPFFNVSISFFHLSVSPNREFSVFKKWWLLIFCLAAIYKAGVQMYISVVPTAADLQELLIKVFLFVKYSSQILEQFFLFEGAFSLTSVSVHHFTWKTYIRNNLGRLMLFTNYRHHKLSMSVRISIAVICDYTYRYSHFGLCFF